MSKAHVVKLGQVPGLVVAMLLAAGCGGGPKVDPLTAAPADAGCVGYINFKQLAGAGLVDDILRMVEEETGRTEIRGDLKAAGVDPKTHLEAALVVMAEEAAESAAIVTGTFDDEAIRVWFKRKRGGTEDRYKKYKLLRNPQGQALCVIKDSILVSGEAKTVRKILDIFKGDAQPLGKDSALLAGVQKFSDHTFWLAAAGAEGREKAPMQFFSTLAPDADLSKVKTVSVGAKATSKVFDLTVVATCTGAGAADGLRAHLKGMLPGVTAAMKLRVPESAGLVEQLATSMKIESKGRNTTVRLGLSVPLMSSLHQARVQERTNLCKERLGRFPAAWQYYIVDKGQSKFYPGNLQQLVEAGCIRDSLLVCPADRAAKAGGRGSYDCVFELADRRLKTTDLLPESMVLWDNAPRHGGKRCVAFADGRVEALEEAEFQKRLRAVKTHLAKLKAGE